MPALDRLAFGHLQPLHDRAARGRRRRCAAAGLRATGRSASEPGSPWRPERPRSWLSMRRDSWRSVPMMCRPPACDHLRRAAPATRRAASSIARCLVVGVERLVGFDDLRSAFSTLPPSTMSVPRPAMLVAMVIIFGPPGLRDDLRLALVLLGVQHLVRQLLLVAAAPRAARSSRSRSCRPAPAGRARSSPDVLDDRVELLLARCGRPGPCSSLRIIGRCVGITTVSRP